MKPLLLLLLSLAAACSEPPMSAETRRDFAQAMTTDWYASSKAEALNLIDEYGPPDQIKSSRLVWQDKGPWKRMTLWNVEDRYYSEAAGPENLAQTLAYQVPRGKRPELAAFSGRLSVSRDGRELTARGGSEAMNFLALNLADEIVRGARDAADARSFFERASRLAQAGKSSPYMERLLFVSPKPEKGVPEGVPEAEGRY